MRQHPAEPAAENSNTVSEGTLNLVFLRLAIGLIFAGSLAFAIVLYLVAPDQAIRAAGSALLSLVAAIVLLLLNKGRAEAAMRVLAFGIWAVVTAMSIVGGGLRAPLAIAYPAIILITGWLLGLRSAIALVILTVLTGFGFALGELWGFLPLPPPAPPFLLWTVQAITLVIATVLIGYVLRGHEARFQKVRHLGGALAERVGTLTARENQLRLITENVPAMIFHGDRELRCLYANRQFVEFFRGNAEDIAGMPLQDILGEELFQAATPRIARVLAGEKVQFRGKRRSAAGDMRMLDVSLVPDIGTDGSITGFYALKRDITEQERSEESLRLSEAELHRQYALYDALLAAQSDANVGLFIIDEGKVVFANRALCNLYGYTEDEIKSLPDFLILAHPDDRERILENHRRRLAGERFENRYNIGILTKSGERREAEITVGVMPSEQGTRILVIMVDISERRRAEEEMRRSGEKFSRVFRNSPLPISISRLADGRYLEVNDAFAEQFGWSKGEMVGHTSVEVGPWPNGAERERWADMLRKAGRVRDFEATLLTKHGNPRNVLIFAERFDLGGEDCILTMLYDDTDRGRAEEALRTSQARLTEAQRIGRIGSWELDLASSYFLWSEEINRIFEATEPPGQVNYATFLKNIHPDDRQQFDKTFTEAIAAGKPYDGTHRLRMRDGRVKFVQVRAETHCDADGKPLKVVGTTQDITEQHLAQQEIQRLNAELESRVQVRTAELMSANRELESFAYSISHDLRAPLRGIDGFSQLLIEEYRDKLDKQGQDYLGRVRRAAQRMGTLIDDILELSRVTRLEMRRVRVDLSQIARDVLEERKQSEPQSRVAWQIAPDCVAVGDPQLLRVLMQNLLENAWKYSGRAANPAIEFGREDAGGNTVFFVRDNGVGFDMHYADRLFRPFQRLHSPEEFEGTGVGLATVARVVNRHGGRVWAESAAGRGATFRFTLGRSEEIAAG